MTYDSLKAMCFIAKCFSKLHSSLFPKLEANAIQIEVLKDKVEYLESTTKGLEKEVSAVIEKEIPELKSAWISMRTR